MNGKRIDAIIAVVIADRGFGFCRPHYSENDSVFLHVNDFREHQSMFPRAGTRISYVEGRDRNGKLHAKDIVILGTPT